MSTKQAKAGRMGCSTKTVIKTRGGRERERGNSKERTSGSSLFFPLYILQRINKSKYYKLILQVSALAIHESRSNQNVNMNVSEEPEGYSFNIDNQPKSDAALKTAPTATHGTFQIREISGLCRVLRVFKNLCSHLNIVSQIFSRCQIVYRNSMDGKRQGWLGRTNSHPLTH